MEKWTGSAFTSNVIVPRDSFKVTKGTPRSYDTTGDSGKLNKHFFCGDCGSSLYSELEIMSDKTGIKAGTLDGGEAHLRNKVDVEFYVKDRVHYLNALDNVRQEPRLGQRCYVGVSGGSCSSCRRAKLDCDAHGSTPARSVTEEPNSLLTYCPEDIFASQLRESERECNVKSGMAGNPAVLSTIPLDYHISIINQLFGPGSAAPPAVRLPSYLVGLPDRLHSDDIEYLRCSGALDLPSETLRNELLKSYLLWVHPHMPILGLHEFLSAVAGDNESHRISLLLFHAVLFAASAFVDECHIRAEGYPSRSVFRESISCKVKVLLDFECEDDRLATAQALLLWVSHPEPHHDQKELTQRLGICISMISSSQTQMVKANARKQQIWRRTWWSIYNHVRITSSNPLTLKHDPENGDLCDTPLPSTHDFRFGALSPNVQTLVGNCDFLRDVQYQQFLARLFIEKSKLCQIGQFPGPSRDLSDSSSRVVGLASAENKACPTEIAELARRLGRWHTQLPPALRHQSTTSTAVTELEKFILVHRAWLLLLYLASAYVVCTCSVGRNSHAEEHILNRISLVFDELHRLGFINVLPNPSVAILMPAVEFHITAVESACPQTNGASQRMLQQFSEILHQLQGSSALAGRMIEKLNNITATETKDDLSRVIASESAIAEQSVSNADFVLDETDDFYSFLESGMSFANVIPLVDNSPNIGLDPPLCNESYFSQLP
ncbi:hypothetical protein KXW98_002468 [Aspergillus fumigatus]|uniref:Uncharacterized protein n=1 Tax=Aspergillus fumigatus TaxID=746128 RepID=A0A8H4HYR5_ASPFM|nr:hypothetical protein CNMCM8057_002301 [Aspergillus fumigatus]KAH1279100.1 hypothetical protein KXX45_008036 [Aspergillus fumigatus]KAH1295408.1 hypothetical protein KXX48_002582 [Aspergillus fumigatus]KAH1297793.1 hypothetical protein KXX30_007714 [Aspergillus fumigatus]KAH1322927.1 hypothetical protein KXX38_007909 [Aspergillus fumigatus]